MKLRIAGIDFKTKKDLRKFVSEIVARYNGHKFYSSDNGGYFNFFRQLITMHPNFKDKVGDREISHFEIVENKYKKPTLYICFPNKIKIDISWNKCINGKNTTYDEKLNSAMRNAIEYQVFGFVQDRKNMDNICHVCGEKVNYDEDYHVDHVIRFKDLKNYFIQKTIFELPRYFNSGIGYFFKEEDGEFQDSWRIFHGENSILAITHSQCNLKRK